MRRLQQEERAMEKYVRNKEMSDTLNEERKKKMIKQKEMEAKRILDIQIQEREERQRLRRFEADKDANFMEADI